MKQPEVLQSVELPSSEWHRYEGSIISERYTPQISNLTLPGYIEFTPKQLYLGDEPIFETHKEERFVIRGSAMPNSFPYNAVIARRRELGFGAKQFTESIQHPQGKTSLAAEIEQLAQDAGASDIGQSVPLADMVLGYEHSFINGLLDRDPKKLQAIIAGQMDVYMPFTGKFKTLSAQHIPEEMKIDNWGQRSHLYGRDNEGKAVYLSSTAGTLEPVYFVGVVRPKTLEELNAEVEARIDEQRAHNAKMSSLETYSSRRSLILPELPESAVYTQDDVSTQPATAFVVRFFPTFLPEYKELNRTHTNQELLNMISAM